MIDVNRLEDLVLARMCVQGARRLSPSDLTKALGVFLEHELSQTDARKQIAEALARLRQSGCVEPETLALTDAGKQRLCAALGVPALPNVRNWGEFKRKHLVRLFEKGPLAAEPAMLGLRLIARKLGLPERSARSESALANAWLAHALGLEGDWQSPFRIRTASLATSLNVPARPRLEDVLRISVKALSGARTASSGDVAQALAARWVTGGSVSNALAQAQKTPRDAMLGESAVNKVREALHGAGVRRYGPSKVFIGSVWERLREDPDFSQLGEAGFKDFLVAAHQRGDLTLSRADLVSAMDPADVAASETRHLNATYHFIQDSGEHT